MYKVKIYDSKTEYFYNLIAIDLNDFQKLIENNYITVPADNIKKTIFIGGVTEQDAVNNLKVFLKCFENNEFEIGGE
jgi:UDP-N-acetylglucosamine pyrophosphorylase